MADDIETAIDDSTLAEPLQGSPSQFLEILCTSSGKTRRFSPNTESGFALQLINKKLDYGVPLASYIEAVKEGEEPISFCPTTKLVDFGDGWKLHTVIDEDDGGFEENNSVLPMLEQLPDVIELARDDVQSATNHALEHQNPPLLEENNPLTSEPVSDIESQSLEKWDFTDTFATDKVFSCRDELVTWTKDVGRSVGNVVIIKYSSSGPAKGGPRICFGCERSDKKREHRKRDHKNESDKPTSTRTRKSKSKKCECPFVLRGIKMKESDEWKLKVECGHHNHPVESHLQSSSRVKLTAEEKELVIGMSRAGIGGREIIKVLKERDPLNEATLKTIYNTRTKAKPKKLETSECNSS